MHVQYLFLTATNSGANPVLVQNNPGTQAISLNSYTYGTITVTQHRLFYSPNLHHSWNSLRSTDPFLDQVHLP